MGFKPISFDNYIKMYLKNNPSESGRDLLKKLNTALADYNNGKKCFCGNDIWVIGSASLGNGCFTCLTGENNPDDDYEIDSALTKRENKKGKRHIDEMEPDKISGYFDDDGYEINIDLINKPSLCVTCVYDDDPDEEILCNLTRIDQNDNEEFICFGYKKK